jgi:tripartite-type tricarboxylate transporter receptor subunit TctC
MTRATVAILSALSMLVAWGASAQSDYPSRLVTIVVAAGPGGVLDIAARTIAQRLSARFNQQVIVENKGGAGGGLGTGHVAKAAPDGYTLLFAAEAPLVINPYLYKTLTYDPLTELAPITQVGFQSYYVVVCPKLPVTKLSDLVALSREKPLSYASIGHGTTMHLSGELLMKGLKVGMTHVPYRGVAPAIADIISCNIDIEFIAIGTALPLIKEGKVKPIAVSTPARWPETPEVPTLRESGFQEMEQVESSFSMLAPAKTPRPIIDTLHAEVSRAMNEEAQKFTSRGMRMVLSRPDEFGTWLAAASQSYKNIIADAKIEKMD